MASAPVFTSLHAYEDPTKKRKRAAASKKKGGIDEEDAFKLTTDIKPPPVRKISAKERKVLDHLQAMRDGREMGGTSSAGQGWVLRWSVMDAPAAAVLVTATPQLNLSKLEDVLETLAAVLVRQYAMAAERGFWQGMAYTSRTGVTKAPQWITFLDVSKSHRVRWEFEMDTGPEREPSEEALQAIWTSVHDTFKGAHGAMARRELPLGVAFKLALGLRATKAKGDSDEDEEEEL